MAEIDPKEGFVPKRLELGGPLSEADVTDIVKAQMAAFSGSPSLVKGRMRLGQRAYDDGEGYWFGFDNGKVKFSIGNSAGKKLTWDGDILSTGGLVLNNVGYIATALTGTRCEMSYSQDTGFSHGLRLYDATDALICRLAAGGGSPIFTLNGGADRGCARFLNSDNTCIFDTIEVTARGLQNGIYVKTDGFTDRELKAGIYLENFSDKGYGEYLKNDADSIGDLVRWASNTQKGRNLLLIEDTDWAGTHEARITNENYIQFPAYYHCSDFDENLAGDTALASTVIAKAYWDGSGTNGTQILKEGTNQDKNTYVAISTTATANSTSILQSGRYIGFDQICIEVRVRFSSKTNTAVKIGFQRDASNYSYFLFDTAVDAAKIYFNSSDGASSASVDTGLVMITNAWRTFRIILYPGAVRAFIDDYLIPQGIQYVTANSTKAYIYIDNKAAAEEKIAYVDYVKIWKGRNNTEAVS